jgi:hypothetical protein
MHGLFLHLSENESFIAHKARICRDISVLRATIKEMHYTTWIHNP